MIRFLIERPIAVLVSFFAITLLGCVAFLKLPVSLLPDVDIPVISIRLDAGDRSAEEIETHIAAPLRQGLMQLKALEDLESRCSEGKATLTLTFDPEVDISMAFIEVNEKVDMAMNGLPRDIARPLVSKNSISDMPVFRLDVFPKNHDTSHVAEMADVSNFAREVIRRRLEQIAEVAMVDLSGYIEAQIELTPKVGYLKSMHLTNEVLTQAFQENRVSLGNILVKDGHYSYFLRFSSELQSVESIRRTPIVIEGRLFNLGDLMEVAYTFADPKGYYFSRDRQAINFAVIKQSAARISDLKSHFYEVVEQMKNDYPDLTFKVSRDQTKLLDFSISNLQQDLIIGGILAFLLMLIFIRKMSMAVLIGITIPLSLILSQLGFYVFGISINIISLGGLILGLTMIIDSSIVVMDAISEQENEGKNQLDAAVYGTNEVMRPLITSVLTNCAVFVPLIFMSGLAGALFYDQALSIVVGVVSSLIVALLLLPPLFYLLRRRKGTARRWEIPVFVNVTQRYDRMLRWSFRHPLIVTCLFVMTTVLGFVLFTYIKKDRLPKLTRTELEIDIDWNEFVTMEESRFRTLEIYDRYKASVQDYQVWIGEQHYLLPSLGGQSSQQVKLYFKLSTAEEFGAMEDSLMHRIATKYPRAIVRASPSKNAFDEVFYQKKAPLRLMVSDSKGRRLPDRTDLQRFIDTIRHTFAPLPIASLARYPKINLRINVEKVAQLYLSMDQVESALVHLFKKEKVSDFQDAQYLIPIYMMAPWSTSFRDLLKTSFVRNTFGEDIPLDVLLEVGYRQDYPEILAGNFGPFYPIDIASKDPVRDVQRVKNLTSKYPNLTVSIDGSFFENEELVYTMAIILLVSVLLLYFILAAQFESLVQPLFILVELPIAICGSMLFLYLGDSSLNLMSMIGIVVMSGLIINDSILKIDAINQLRRRGAPLMEAIFEGGHRRIRSIVMISLTSVGALFPTLLMSDLGSELQRPLALALMGGMLVGLLVSLFFVPIVYWSIYKRREIHD